MVHRAQRRGCEGGGPTTARYWGGAVCGAEGGRALCPGTACAVREGARPQGDGPAIQRRASGGRGDGHGPPPRHRLDGRVQHATRRHTQHHPHARRRTRAAGALSRSHAAITRDTRLKMAQNLLQVMRIYCAVVVSYFDAGFGPQGPRKEFLTACVLLLLLLLLCWQQTGSPAGGGGGFQCR